MDLYSTLSLWLTNIRAVPDVDDFSRRVIELHSVEKLTDDEANRLLEKASCRSGQLRIARSEGLAPPSSYYPETTVSGISRWLAATGSRNPERWNRKRRLGDMASLAPQFRDLFTEGERSATGLVLAQRQFAT